MFKPRKSEDRKIIYDINFWCGQHSEMSLYLYSVVELLPRMHNSLNSISIVRAKENKKIHLYNIVTTKYCDNKMENMFMITQFKN